VQILKNRREVVLPGSRASVRPAMLTLYLDSSWQIASV